MLYDIKLTITYAYDRSANAGRHLLRLTPAHIAGEQRVIAANLDIEPRPEERSALTDFFGNVAAEIAFHSAHAEIGFVVSTRVERFAEALIFDMSPTLSQLTRELNDYRALGADSPHHFLGPSPRIGQDPAITAYARDVIRSEMTAIEIVRSIGAALQRDIRYDTEATTVDTTPEEAFARRRGVCQDITQIMISGLRGLGVPAGYVSGVLRTNPPPGKQRLEGADAMHAWVRAWCGVEAGWVEFDPTNAMVVGADHVVFARGRDYSDVAPVKGVLRTAGSQISEQAVDVKSLG
ncbi:MAG: transglutaminase N-terminal domain-containing protein [Amphiplicatus sp.]